MNENIDPQVVSDFGREWSQFDQAGAPQDDLLNQFAAYFDIFPWAALKPGAEGFDLGCGSGRWAQFVAPRVGRLHLIDPSEAALSVAQRKLDGFGNCTYHCTSVDSIPLKDGSADFGYSLGVLHHVPDTQAGIESCVRKLKPGAPLLLYLYYAFDNRPPWFRSVWQVSDLLRRLVSRAPFPVKYAVSQILAALVYLPLVTASRLGERLGLDVENVPLSAYRTRSYYSMRTDALDRFGTRLEQRFTRLQIERMMRGAGLEHVAFSGRPPYWCAVGYRAS